MEKREGESETGRSPTATQLCTLRQEDPGSPPAQGRATALAVCHPLREAEATVTGPLEGAEVGDLREGGETGGDRTFPPAERGPNSLWVM